MTEQAPNTDHQEQTPTDAPPVDDNPERAAGLPDDLIGQLPDDLRDKPVEDIVSTLLKQNAGFRKAQAQKPKLPDDPKAYEFEPAETIKPYFGKGDGDAPATSDPAIDAARVAAMKHGLTPDQFNGFINDVFSTLAENGGLPDPGTELVALPPIDPASELKTFAEAEGISDKDAVSRRADELAAFGKQLVAQHDLGDAAAIEIEAMTQTAGGLRLLSAIQSSLQERGFAVGGDAWKTGMTDEEYAALAGKLDLTPEEARRFKEEAARRASAREG